MERGNVRQGGDRGRTFLFFTVRVVDVTVHVVTGVECERDKMVNDLIKVTNDLTYQ